MYKKSANHPQYDLLPRSQLPKAAKPKCNPTRLIPLLLAPMVQPLPVVAVTKLSRFGGAINPLKYRQNVQNSYASVLTVQT
jgi:hypothetical protein